MTSRISTFKCDKEQTILHAGRVVWSEGCRPCRIVLRKHGDDYITHMELLVFNTDRFQHDAFHDGHYYRDDKAKAEEDFERRCKEL
jgi:hypothetical protein